MASEPKDYTIFIWMILTSNTEATENKVQFFLISHIYIPTYNIYPILHYPPLILSHSLRSLANKLVVCLSTNGERA